MPKPVTDALSIEVRNYFDKATNSGRYSSARIGGGKTYRMSYWGANVFGMRPTKEVIGKTIKKHEKRLRLYLGFFDDVDQLMDRIKLSTKTSGTRILYLNVQVKMA